MYSSSLGMNKTTARMGGGGGFSGGGGGSSLLPNGQFYPRRVTYALSALKIVTGCGLVTLGALALYQKASYARSASGLWTGIIVIISGVFGAFTVRTNASRAYVLSFFVACALALIADVLTVIYSSTGLAQDSGFPGGFVRDDITGDLIPVSQVNIPSREKAMLVNMLLIIVGVLDVLFTLPCLIICLREVCQCYYGHSDQLQLLQADYRESGVMRNDWLLSWLGQQQQQQQQVYFSGASGLPSYAKPPHHHAFVFLPSEHSHQQSSRHPSPRESHRKFSPIATTAAAVPLELYHPHFYYPSSGSSLAQLVPLHASSPHQQWVFGGHPPRGHSRRRERRQRMHQQHHKRNHSSSFNKSVESRKKKSGRKSGGEPTDSDIDRTYTGLDRELAEEFIEQTMDPAIVLERTQTGRIKPQVSSGGSKGSQQAISGNESEAW